MPVFTEEASAARARRTERTLTRPLPRVRGEAPAGEDEFEVVVVGAGPAGLFLTLLLARYGLTDASLLALDAKPSTLQSGQADGLQPRTLEVLQGLGLADEILRDGCHMYQVAFWSHERDEEDDAVANGTSKNEGIHRQRIIPDVAVPARFPHEVTIHQGRIERIFEEDLRRYSQRGVLRSARFTSFRLDPATNAAFPIAVSFESSTTQPDGTTSTTTRTVRTKHLVGADGAHSSVRRDMGLALAGESRDHIWGVVDLVLDTDFPDIRRRCAIHSAHGSVMVIPRERIQSGEFLTRLYVQVDGSLLGAELDAGGEGGDARARRKQVSLKMILEQARRVMAPYKVENRYGDEVDWWAAYQIGQRLTERFILQDEEGVERVFIVGDACHTHSPKAGQGMNVSMMDSLNLSWKLVHTLLGLTPTTTSSSSSSPTSPTPTLLSTFQSERHTVAQQLIDFDATFSAMFSGATGRNFHEAFLVGSGFTSGTGIEYAGSVAVGARPSSTLTSTTTTSSSSTEQADPNAHAQFTHLTPGRRLFNTTLARFADGSRRALHDELALGGRYYLLILLPSPLPPSTTSLLTRIFAFLATRPHDVVLPAMFVPGLTTGADGARERVRGVEELPLAWTDFPPEVKRGVEMAFYVDCVEGGEGGGAYRAWGVDEEEGALVVVRPDGVVGCRAGWDAKGWEAVERWLGGLVVGGS